MLTRLVAFTVAAAFSLPAFAGEIVSSVDPQSLGKQKTDAGLYLTSSDAYKALQADPSIVFIDVRTQAEFSYVGHPDPVDQNIPWNFLTDTYNAKSGAYNGQSNKNFLKDVEALMAREGKGKDDPIFLICRSGSRSAAAVNTLTKAGYTKAYNVVDGFEGGTDKGTGHRTVEGWRHDDLPWGYKIPEAIAYKPAE